MMNPTVIDSCVAYKWLCARDESGVDVANALLDSHASGATLLVAPDILHVELANAVRNSPYLDEEHSVAVIEELDGYHVELLPSTPARLAKSVRLSCLHRISIYDALFLQLAQELDCPLVTADRRAFANIDAGVEVRLI